MKLTTTIEWHNLLDDPEDLPSEHETLYVAFLKDNKIWIEGIGEEYCYNRKLGLFYYTDESLHNIYNDDEELQNYGQIVAWAEKSPIFDAMENALTKEILGKDKQV